MSSHIILFSTRDINKTPACHLTLRTIFSKELINPHDNIKFGLAILLLDIPGISNHVCHWHNYNVTSTIQSYNILSISRVVCHSRNYNFPLAILSTDNITKIFYVVGHRHNDNLPIINHSHNITGITHVVCHW